MKIHFWKIGVIIFAYYIIYGIYQGISQPIPAFGDSFDYHMPIQQMIISGEILNPQNVRLPQWYYPGATESLNALLLILGIPLTISNIIAILFLVICCFRLALSVGFDYELSIFFSMVIGTLNGIIRWMNAVSIDIWLTGFIILSLSILHGKYSSHNYYFILGIIFGMIIGSKISAGLFILLFVGLYWTSITRGITFTKALCFIVPFLLVGLSWYFRNFLITGNPFYPMIIFGLPGDVKFSYFIFNAFLDNPKQLLDAVFGEYVLMSLTFPLVFLFTGWVIMKKQMLSSVIKKLILFATVTTFLFIFFYPTSTEPWIMVSSMRYSYVPGIILILLFFYFFRYFKKGVDLYLFSIGSMLMVSSFQYLPKLTLIYFPISILTIYILVKKKTYILKTLLRL